MRVLVTGAKGQLGHDVVNELEKRGIDWHRRGHRRDGYHRPGGLPQSDHGRRGRTRSSTAPPTRLWTPRRITLELCSKINARRHGAILPDVCRDLDIKMMYISTDYVFNGQGVRPWEPDDEREPLNVYGMTKYRGRAGRGGAP